MLPTETTTVVKGKTITNTKLAVATIFLGITGIAAATLPTMDKSIQCIKSKDYTACKKSYEQCLKYKCTNSNDFGKCKDTCLTNALHAKPEEKINLCGNKVVDTGEQCDNGDNNDNNGVWGDCRKNCTLISCGDNIVDVVAGEECDPPKSFEYNFFECLNNCKSTYKLSANKDCPLKENIVYTIQDENGLALSDAEIKIYKYDMYKEPFQGGFPYHPYSDDHLYIKGITDGQGKYVIKKGIFGKYIDGYQVLVSKSGYVTKILSIGNCSNMLNGGIFKMPKILDGTKGSSNIKDYGEKEMPVKVESDYTYWSRIEVADRPIFFPFVPHVQDKLLINHSSVDLEVKIIGIKTTVNWYNGAPSLGQNLDVNIIKEIKDVSLDQINSVEFSVPEGTYYIYFVFNINYISGIQQKYSYFPFGIYQTDLSNEYLKFNFSASSTDVLKDGWKLGSKEKNTDINLTTKIQVYPKNAAYNFEFKPLPGIPNDVNSKRINIIFLNQGFEKTFFEELVLATVDEEKNSFFGVEPYKSNRNKFNLWYYSDPMTVDEAKFPIDNYNLLNEPEATFPKAMKLYLSHNFNSKTIWVVMVNDENIATNIAAVSGKCVYKKGITFAISKTKFEECLNNNTLNECIVKFDMLRSFWHEMGHELGYLGEEYNGSQKLFNQDNFVDLWARKYNLSFRSNTFFPEDIDPEKDCYNTTYSGGEIEVEKFFGNDFVCLNDNISCEKSSWHDYVGNGCREEGIKDCIDSNPSYFKEIGCFSKAGYAGEKNSYSNLFKPNYVSVMSLGADFNSIPFQNYRSRIYGLSNERELCRAIREYTGKVEGVCKEHCLDRCDMGQKCIQGKCQ